MKKQVPMAEHHFMQENRAMLECGAHFPTANIEEFGDMMLYFTLLNRNY